MKPAVAYAAWCLRNAPSLAGLLVGASLRDLVLRSDLRRLGFPVGLRECRGLGAAALEVSIVPRLRRALGTAPPRTVLDVGAEYGQFARAATLAFPGCRVWSFEPQAASHRRLVEALRHRGDSVAFPFGLGDREETAPLRVSGNPGSSSLLAMGPGHVRAFPGTDTIGEEKVRVRRLDALVAEGTIPIVRPLLLKIDVQGFEDRVLGGCDAVLDAVDAAIVEMSPVPLYEGQPLADAVKGILEGRGLRFEGAFDEIRSPGSGGVVQIDGLFRRRWEPVAAVLGRASRAFGAVARGRGRPGRLGLPLPRA